MPSPPPIINKQAFINQKSLTPPVKTNKSKHSKKIMIHQSGSPLPPDDFVLFPQDVVKEKHSSVRHTIPRKPPLPESAKRASSSTAPHHVIEAKARMPSQRDTRRPSAPRVCLDHMSTVNCTVDCANAKSLAHEKRPPKAPSPPRLPTPDLSDLEEDDLWSCCGSSWSSLGTETNRCNGKADSMWDEMEEKLTKAKTWQSRSSTDSRKAVLLKDR